MGESVVIVGASLAGLRTAQGLREWGFQGPITLIGSENGLPYDRPPLSKQVLAGKQSRAEIELTSAAELEDLDIAYRSGTRAASLDPVRRRIELADGESLEYGVVVIATGASARRAQGPAPERGVFYLRDYADAAELGAQFAAGPRVAVIGGGFIGAESACAARDAGLSVTVLEALPAPLSRVLGSEVGDSLGDLHRQHGVKVRCGVPVRSIEGTRHVTGVRLADDTLVPADLVIVGIGATPAVDWLSSSGLALDDGVLCDQHCQAVGVDNVYAVGDVARWMNPRYATLMRVEHWTNAGEQAAAVAESIAREQRAYDHVPYVWSQQYGHKIQLVGRIFQPESVRWLSGTGGDPRALAVAYGSNGQLDALIAVDQPRLIARARRLISEHSSWADGLGALERGVAGHRSRF
jgi:3-phenylpropionate/trans-cinnamate dioxygenase ferredoxin reductase subunit